MESNRKSYSRLREITTDKLGSNKKKYEVIRKDEIEYLQDTELKNIKNVIGSVLKSAFTENHEAQDILLFEGEKPEIKVKGRWQILESCDKWEQDHFNYFLFNMSNISTKNRDG